MWFVSSFVGFLPEVKPRGIRLEFSVNEPVSLTPIDEAALTEFARLVDDFSIHDGLVVASHRSNGVTTVLTNEPSSRMWM